MASFNSSLFLSLLVVISAFMASPSSVEAQFLNTIVRTNGTVRCAVNITLPLNGTVPPPFPNAAVELRCGNTSLANTTTNVNGIFDISFRLTQALLNIPNLVTLLLNPGNCNAVVRTPLTQCNAALPPVGRLVANVTDVGLTAGSTGVNIINLVTSQIFQLVNNLPI